MEEPFIKWPTWTDGCRFINWLWLNPSFQSAANALILDRNMSHSTQGGGKISFIFPFKCNRRFLSTAHATLAIISRTILFAYNHHQMDMPWRFLSQMLHELTSVPEFLRFLTCPKRKSFSCREGIYVFPLPSGCVGVDADISSGNV